MEMRRLGRTGIEVSALGFGCGAVGGLMVRGSPGDQERAVARAIELASTISTPRPCTGTANPSAISGAS
jgi:aryl-alcohol dehydrogenase-like predicted oxidoreductase